MGQLALELAIAAAVAWAVVGAVPQWRRFTVAAAVLTAALAAAAVVALVAALIRVDPSLSYVARHASSATPLQYRIAGAWGGMEGSLLVWAALTPAVFACGSWRTARRRAGPDGAASSAAPGLALIGSFTTAVFLAVSRVSASPFETLDVPTGRGRGLLAVLQHPAMVYHPPILYAGLALVAVPFALTMAAAWERRLDRSWLDAVVPWLRASWLVLGIGIVAGSQWAYAELGWGGFWAWDPVENAALLPWLATTVALHGAAATRATGRLPLTTAAAVAGAFCLMVSGVYVTRSGSTGSIHAFADSTAIGRPLLLFALVSVVASVVVLLRLGLPGGSPWGWRRDLALAAQAALGGIAVLAIAVGTLWPVVDGVWWSSATQARELVRPAYYHRVLAPIVIAALLAMAIGPELRWAGGRRGGGRAATGAALGALGALLICWWLGIGAWRGASVAALGGAALGASVGAVVARPGSIRRSRRSVGVALAHGGFALVMLGAVAAGTGDDHQVRVGTGEVATIGAWTVELERLDVGSTDRFEFVRAVVVVDLGGTRSRHEPELRAYEDQPIPTAESSIAGSLRGDTIVVLDAIDPGATEATITVRRRPLMPWVWAGAVAMLLGGAVAMRARRPPASAAEPAAARRPAATVPPR